MPRRVCWTLLALLAFARLAAAQELADSAAGRGPRFLLAAALHPVPVDISRTPVLRQRISLDLRDVPLKEALTAIARQSGLDLVYSDDVLPVGARVSLRAEGITVAAALTDVLTDADVDVVFSRNGRAALVPRAKAGVLDSGSVRGRVTDAKTGQAIAGAGVVLVGTRWHATTDESGQYRIHDVAAGTYTLTASRIGYVKQNQSVTVAAGQEVTADAALQAVATELEQLVVTGTVVPTERKALPTPISVITADDIAQQNLQRVDEVFRGDVPGAIAWDQGPFNNFSTVAVRGATELIGTSGIKTFIDGVEVAEPIYIATIDPNTVDRVEIIRGPQASTLYGSGALNGVMQVFTKKGRFDHGPELTGKVSVGGVSGFDGSGTALQTDNAVSLLGGDNKTTYSLSAAYSYIGEWVPSYHTPTWNVAAGGQTTQGLVTLSSSLRYVDKTIDLPWDTRFQTYTAFSKPPYITGHLRQQTEGVTTGWQATPSWLHTFTVGYDQSYFTLQKTQPSLTTPADTFLFTSAILRTKTSLLYHTDLSVGLGKAMRAVVAAGVNYDGFNGAVSSTLKAWTNTGYFGQVQISAAERLFLTAGLRAEQNPNFGADFGTAWSPRIGAAYVWTLGPTTVKLRGSYGESIRAPDPGERDALATPYSVQLANPSLAPERQRGIDGGVEVYLERTSLSVTYYNQQAIDLLTSVAVPPPPGDTLPTSQWQNISRVKNNGWEFEVRRRSGPLQVSGTYSITNSTVRKLSPDYPAGRYQVGDPILGIPHRSGGVTVTYWPLPKTTLTTSVTYIGHWTENDVVGSYGFYFGGQPYRGSQRAYWIGYPAVTKVAVGVNQTLGKGLTTFLRVENLGNSLRYEQNNGNIPKPRSVIVGATFRY